ncbi:Rrf2 family transcriptional regulator [Candidatus Bipolaricaulota bacterium]|nr:Rrf2 family transcriptional regulator [Candidatus Bipolaricaulota bacterium]
MLLTKKASYGLIAAAELVRVPDGEPVSARCIAEKYDLPSPFVEKILHELKTAGIVDAVQGRYGGYRLILRPEEISVRDILVGLGESLELVGCLTAEAQGCHIRDACPTRSLWQQINHRFVSLLDSLTLADVANP